MKNVGKGSCCCLWSWANITPMKLPLWVVTEPDKKQSSKIILPVCRGSYTLAMLLPDDVMEVHGPWLISILAPFCERQQGKLFHLMAPLLSQWVVACVGCAMSIMVRKDIDVAMHLPCSACLQLKGSFSWSGTIAMKPLHLICLTQLCSRD